MTSFLVAAATAVEGEKSWAAMSGRVAGSTEHACMHTYAISRFSHTPKGVSEWVSFIATDVCASLMTYVVTTLYRFFPDT